MDDLVRTISDGLAGLVSGSIAALGAAFGAIVGTLQAWLPGPLFPIALVGAGVLVYWWLFKR
jgi:hypothetical protein